MSSDSWHCPRDKRHRAHTALTHRTLSLHTAHTLVRTRLSYYYYYFLNTQGSKDPRVKKKAEIKMSDGHRSGRSTGRVSCKSTELKRRGMIEIIIIIILTFRPNYSPGSIDPRGYYYY